MESISRQRRGELSRGARDLRKLELRDSYAGDSELLASWLAGDSVAVESAYRVHREEMRQRISSGQAFSRVRVVSEPLSDYQRMAVELSGAVVEVGHDLRWLPRHLVSATALPGNDCFILDGAAVMFNIYDGNTDLVDVQFSADPEVVAFCVTAFATAWDLGTPHNEYHPVDRPPAL